MAEEAFWAGPEDGTYPCPCCDLEVTVVAGDAVHDEVPEVKPGGDTIQLAEGDGAYRCPDCGEDIEVDDGVAKHARVHTRRDRTARCRASRK